MVINYLTADDLKFRIDELEDVLIEHPDDETTILELDDAKEALHLMNQINPEGIFLLYNDRIKYFREYFEIWDMPHSLQNSIDYDKLSEQFFEGCNTISFMNGLWVEVEECIESFEEEIESEIAFLSIF